METQDSKGLFSLVGKEYGIDPDLLYSIAVVESSVVAKDRKGFIRPYPWTLRTNRPIYANSRKEAEKHLKNLLAQGKQVDVGLMQINTKWHLHRVKSPEELLDPSNNLRIAAEILNEQIRRTPQDVFLAVGNYHSYDPDRARWYARHVFRVYTKIKTKHAQKSIRSPR